MVRIVFHKYSFIRIIGHAIIITAFILAYPAYENSLGLLTVDDGQHKAEAIIILGGGTPERHIRAAELFKQGAAPIIISTGDGEPETAPLLLMRYGIPRSAIVVESRSKTTLQNAQKTLPILRQHGITNAILVTSWFHSRRSKYTFEKVAPDIKFISRPTYWGCRQDHWKRCGLRYYIIREYIKIPWYWLRINLGI